MAHPRNSRTSHSRTYERARPVGPPAGAAGEVSLGFVVNETDPGRAARLCDAVTASAPTGVKVEFLILDDHTNPRRRDLVDVVDQHGDAVRLVPRPGLPGCAELDAVSHACRSDFVVFSFGHQAPWNAVTAAMGELWIDGADVVAVGGIGADAAFPAEQAELHSRLAECVGLMGTGGIGDRGGPGRFVLVRRWVARWMFSEIPRDAELSEELADRARLLGLRMLVLDSRGMPINRA